MSLSAGAPSRRAHRYERLTNPRARTFRPIDERESWVVTCFFVRRDQRRKESPTPCWQLCRSFVAERGGSLVEGYPVEHVDHGAAALYTGTTGMFQRAGFVEVARPGGRPLVRLEVRRR